MYKNQSVIWIIFILRCFVYVNSVVPPEYFINLDVTESFIISDIFDSDDANDFNIDDLEMIKEPYEEILKPEDEDKFFMLQNIAKRKHREAIESGTKTTTSSTLILTKIPEYHYEMDDEPAYAMFIEESAISNVKKKETNNKTRSTNNKREEEYNYLALKNEFDLNTQKEKRSKEVFKYEDVTEKEGLKDAAKNIIKFKPPINCTKEEMKGIGINAARCFYRDMKTAKKKTAKEQKILFVRLLKMIFIWLCVYLIIAIPCWCTRGWCCCCCRCKFCKPRKTINETIKFLADNPVGVLHVDGKKVTYQPTEYEDYAQRRLEKVIMKL